MKKEAYSMNRREQDEYSKNRSGPCMDRRDFLAGLSSIGGAALAVNLGLLQWSTGKVLGALPMPGQQGPKPLIRVGFCQAGPGELLETGWPGMAYDPDASQVTYTRALQEGAGRLNVALHVQTARLKNQETADAFLAEAVAQKADGIVLVNMDGHVYGVQAMHRVLDKRGDRPLSVLAFIPHGTLHSNPGVYQRFREAPYFFAAGSSDVGWLAEGLRLLKARWQMANTRMAVVTGDASRESRLDPLGTVLQYTPVQRYVDAYNATKASDEVREISRLYSKNAKGTVEPTQDDLLQAARAYVATRQFLKDTRCQAITMDCFPHVAKRRLPYIYPPCLAFMQLLDEGSTGGCEADIFPAVTELLSSYLLGRPGFLHNPIYDTVRNVYAGAHCKAPSRMAGFDVEPEPYIIRSHHEADYGAVPQVLFKEGQPATLWRFLSPSSLMIAEGTILRNVDSHPADGIGGCRCAFEMALDDVKDVRDVREHHKILTYGRNLRTVRAWAQLSGVTVEHITGGVMT
jgi:hypothetical protein